MESEDCGRSSECPAEILARLQGEMLGGEYQLTVSEFDSEESGVYRSYGIRIRMGERQAQVPDLSPDGEAVRGFVLRCARGDAVPEQLLELAEDFLTELYGLK